MADIFDFFDAQKRVKQPRPARIEVHTGTWKSQESQRTYLPGSQGSGCAGHVGESDGLLRQQIARFVDLPLIFRETPARTGTSRTAVPAVESEIPPAWPRP